MIINFCGLPRSGKTLNAVERVISALRSRRVVCTDIAGFDDPKCIEVIKNVTGLSDHEFYVYLKFLGQKKVGKEIVNEARIFWTFNVYSAVQYDSMVANGEIPLQDLNLWELAYTDKYKTERIHRRYICPPNSLIVLDEVHKTFNCYDSRDANDRACADWASTHGHDGYDVLLITQDISKVNKQIRTLAEMTYYFKKINFLGNLVKSGYLKYTYDGCEHDGKPICNPSKHKYDQHYMSCYMSTSNRAVK